METDKWNHRSTNLCGQKFGMLKVQELTDQKENGYYVWKCKCDCGGEILVNTKKLKRLTVTNCGCVPKTDAKHGSIAENLKGKVFGELTVIDRAPSSGERVCWNCACSCGNSKIVSARDLKSGKITSCGCKTIHSHTQRDLTNQIFGRLTAKYPTEKRDSKGSIVWHCICQCGGETDVTEDALVNHRCISCGCRLEEIHHNIKNLPTFIDGTCLERLGAKKSRSDSKSGFRGIHCAKNGKYSAHIGFKGKIYRLGSYDSFFDAVDARLAAEHTIHDGFVEAYRIWKEIIDSSRKKEGQFPSLIYEVHVHDGTVLVYSNIDIAARSILPKAKLL